jgi:hypothetical protein
MMLQSKNRRQFHLNHTKGHHRKSRNINNANASQPHTLPSRTSNTQAKTWQRVFLSHRTADKPTCDRKKQRRHNSTYPKGGVSCSKDSFVVNQTLVFQIKFCGKSPALRVAANRYGQCYYDRSKCQMNTYV